MMISTLIHARYIQVLIGVVFGCAVAVPIMAGSESTNEILVRWKNTDSIQRYTVNNGVNNGVNNTTEDSVNEVLAALQVNDQVEQVERNVLRSISVAPRPNDVYYDLQYYLDQNSDADIDANQAWQTTTGSRSVVIAVIDTGVDLDHPDLVDNIWVNPGEIAGNGIDDDANGYIDDVNGWDFVENDNDPNPTPTSFSYSTVMVVHGTHVSGILGAVGNNGIGVTGVNWNVTIMPIRVFTEFGDSTAADLVTAVEYANANGADIINMSYGGGSASVFEEEAIHDAFENGVLSIAAAGNETIDLNDFVQYPACYDDVFGVASLTEVDDMSSFSNYGNDCVDVSAAGSNIISAYYYDPSWGLLDEYGYLSGTSMATPVMSGVAGLIHAVNSNISPTTVRKVLRTSADDLNDKRLGQGRVNANRALKKTRQLMNPKKPDIHAYTNSNKKTEIQVKTRTNARKPFFAWKKPSSMNSIAGYYVYWGTQIKNPVVHGTFKTKARFQSPNKIKGNQKKYRLRVKALDTGGNLSQPANFTYIIDTKVNRPIWNDLTQRPNGVELQWFRPKKEHIKGYHVYRAVNGAKKYKKLTSSLVTEERFLDLSVNSGRIYSYKIRAYDNLENRSTLSSAKNISL